MSDDIRLIPEAEQCMCHALVSHIDLRRLNKGLAIDTETACQRRRVQQTTLAVCASITQKRRNVSAGMRGPTYPTSRSR